MRVTSRLLSLARLLALDLSLFWTSRSAASERLFFLLSLTREFCVTLVKFELRDTPALKKSDDPRLGERGAGGELR
ncbi:hypothetical protein J3E68DRAFT_264571 [Trichoderma sp. SZMC 28012]